MYEITLVHNIFMRLDDVDFDMNLANLRLSVRPLLSEWESTNLMFDSVWDERRRFKFFSPKWSTTPCPRVWRDIIRRPAAPDETGRWVIAYWCTTMATVVEFSHSHREVIMKTTLIGTLLFFASSSVLTSRIQRDLHFDSLRNVVNFCDNTVDCRRAYVLNVRFLWQNLECLPLVFWRAVWSQELRTELVWQLLTLWIWQRNQRGGMTRYILESLVYTTCLSLFAPVNYFIVGIANT